MIGRTKFVVTVATVAALFLGVMLGSGPVSAAPTSTTAFSGMRFASGLSMSQPVVVTASVGAERGMTTFAVPNPLPARTPSPVGGGWGNNVQVQWLNLSTGATGTAHLGYIDVPRDACSPTVHCQTKVDARTGSGRIAAIVTLVGPDLPITLLPGFGTYIA